MDNIILKVDLTDVNFFPENEYEEIIQNVKTICSTAKYSVPLDRAFGIGTNIVDKPINQAKALIMSGIIEAINEYEPRVKIVKIDFDGDALNGKLYPVLEIAFKEV